MVEILDYPDDQQQEYYYPLIQESLKVILGHNVSDTRIHAVIAGVADSDMFPLLYPELFPEHSLPLNARTVGQPYYILMFDITERDADIPTEMAVIKGRFATKSMPEGSGIRKRLRGLYNEISPSEFQDVDVTPSNGGNFLHTPDSEKEAMELLAYLAMQEAEGKTYFLYRK
jgi:hypothetical protein